jgi:small subunit ribosomal protein S1
VELGEGVVGICLAPELSTKSESTPTPADLSSLSSMLNARWKTGSGASSPAEPLSAGQVRSFRIVKLDPATKRIELELSENS